MERRTFLAGAAGLVIANKVLAEPQDNGATKPKAIEHPLVEASIAGIYSLAEPELSDTMVVVLKARNKEQYLSMWIGRPEGLSIYAQLQGSKMGRPSSQDFMAELVKSLGGDIESVNITLREQIFYANTIVVGNGKTTQVDGRPSDAIALALRFDAPLFVVSDLLKPSSLEQVCAEIREQSAQQAKELKERATTQTPPD